MISSVTLSQANYQFSEENRISRHILLNIDSSVNYTFKVAQFYISQVTYWLQ